MLFPLRDVEIYMLSFFFQDPIFSNEAMKCGTLSLTRTAQLRILLALAVESCVYTYVGSDIFNSKTIRQPAAKLFELWQIVESPVTTQKSDSGIIILFLFNYM